MTPFGNSFDFAAARKERDERNAEIEAEIQVEAAEMRRKTPHPCKHTELQRQSLNRKALRPKVVVDNHRFASITFEDLHHQHCIVQEGSLAEVCELAFVVFQEMINCPTHPGEMLEEEFLKPLGLTHYRLAKVLNVSQSQIGELVSGKRNVTAAMALRLSAYLGNSPEFWLNLQSRYDLFIERVRMEEELANIPLNPQIQATIADFAAKYPDEKDR